MTGEGRTIIIGDVHGCAAELEALLKALAVSAADRIYFVGDLVARGPATSEVLATFRRLGARGVLGNHELRLLRVREARSKGDAGPRLGPGHERLMAELSDQDWATIGALPLWLDLPLHNVRLVHAGVVQGVPIDAQSTDHLTRMRSIIDGEPSERFRPESWAARYTGNPHIVFGHNARLGVQLHPNATGLDSGCVYGGALTALALAPRQTPPPPDERARLLTSVSAERTYYGG